MLEEPFQQAGWNVETVNWRDPSIDWTRFEVVIIRSPWDYQDDPDAFLNVLTSIAAQGVRLENNLETVLWNIDKRYLRDMESRGVPIVPSLWFDQFPEAGLGHAFSEFDVSEIVVKPVVSANADNTFRLSLQGYRDQEAELKQIFAERPFMAQPFVESIVNEGEFSLFYFGDSNSHSILKTPRKGDFRVQEEHGGRLKLIQASADLMKAAENVVSHLSPMPLYSRIDLARLPNGSFGLMELELIEPSLYFNMDPTSPQRFTDVFVRWMESAGD